MMDYLSRRPVSLLLILILLGWPFLVAEADPASARSAMTDTTNPLIRIAAEPGDIYLELYPAAAPRTVERFLAGLDNGTGRRAYYDGFGFTRTVADLLVQAGPAAPLTDRGLPPLLAPPPTPHEINAGRLTLDQQQLVDGAGRIHPWLNTADQAEFAEAILAPLYQRMGIDGPAMLDDQLDQVISRLEQMTLQQAYEHLGYRYDDSLPSLAPARGRLIMRSAGAEGSTSGFLITLRDMPWLAGRYTVIGRVVEGMTVASRIAQTGGAAPINDIRRLEAGDSENGVFQPLPTL